MNLKLFYFFFILLILSKDPVISSTHSLVKAETVVTASPSSVVGGTINAIDGNFCFGASDLHVPGQEALHVSHY